MRVSFLQMIERLRRSRSAKVEKRELTYDEKVLRRKKIDEVLSDLSPEDTDQVLSRFSRRRFLVRSGKLGVGVVVGAAGLAGVGAYNFGVQTGVQTGTKDERARLLPRGELTPELRAKLVTAKHSVVVIQGLTAAKLRIIDRTIPDFQFTIPEGQPNPDTALSKYRYIAFGPGGVYLPLKEGDDTVGDFTSAVNTANTAAGRIDVSLAYKPGDISDFLEADFASFRETGQSIFQAGHVITSHQVEIDGITNGIAIGRLTSTDPISYIAFDATKEAPIPAGVSPGGFVVAK